MELGHLLRHCPLSHGPTALTEAFHPLRVAIYTKLVIVI